MIGDEKLPFPAGGSPSAEFCRGKMRSTAAPRSVSQARVKEIIPIAFAMGIISLERAMRIELTTEAWEAPILPLNYARGRFSLNALLLYYIFFDLTSDFNKFFEIKPRLFPGYPFFLFRKGRKTAFATTENLFVNVLALVEFTVDLVNAAHIGKGFGIFVDDILKLGYLTGRNDADKKTFLFVFEHALRGNDGYAVTERFDDLRRDLFAVLGDNLEFQRFFRTVEQFVSEFAGNEHVHAGKKDGHKILSVNEDRNGENDAVDHEQHGAEALVRIFFLKHGSDDIRAARARVDFKRKRNGDAVAGTCKQGGKKTGADVGIVG